MAYAGDLDMDGYNDVVIGAPLADEGLGSIYIFRGKSTGLEVTFSQVNMEIVDVYMSDQVLTKFTMFCENSKLYHL